MWDQSALELFSKVGMTRWPILCCSIVGAAIIVERSIYFYKIRFDYHDFSRKLFILLRNNQVMQAIHMCQSHRNPIAKIAGTYLSNLKHKCRDSILSREGSFSLEQVEHRLQIIATITHVAPLLGLLGTVGGLVAAFHEIEKTVGPVQAQSLAGGIWEALLSTVFGLIVAIPCMVAYHGFESCADKVARRIQAMVAELDAFFGNETSSVVAQTKTHVVDDDQLNTAE